jgi:geranylgeranyl diphosphate synthase type I
MISSSPTTARRTEAARSFAAALAEVRRAVDRELADWIAARRRAVAATAPGAAELVDEVARLVASGGKRLRPALVLFTYRACGGREEGASLRLALATELLHTYLLVHDDIMDHAATRRALPTAHAELAARHRRRGWAGDAEDFGRSAAILVGDLAHTWAAELSRPDPATGARAEGDPGAVGRAFDAMCDEVIAGQYLELTLPHAAEATEEDLLRVLRLKSGRYTVERPIELGALLAGAGEAALAALRTYGRAVGEAFQLQDDVLGTFGDADAVGKPVAGDLAEGKLTFLVFHALRLAPTAEADRLRSALGRPDLSSSEIEDAREILRASGALAAVLAMIEERLQAARKALDEPAVPAAGREVLLGLVEYLEERDR